MPQILSLGSRMSPHQAAYCSGEAAPKTKQFQLCSCRRQAWDVTPQPSDQSASLCSFGSFCTPAWSPSWHAVSTEQTLLFVERVHPPVLDLFQLTASHGVPSSQIHLAGYRSPACNLLFTELHFPPPVRQHTSWKENLCFSDSLRSTLIDVSMSDIWE